VQSSSMKIFRAPASYPPMPSLPIALLLLALAAPAWAFKPDGPFDAECRIDERAFAQTWVKYSDIDDRIPVDSRAWEAKQLVLGAERIKELTARRDALRAEMELDRHARLALREYRDALTRGLRVNLLKAFWRLAWVTYGTVKAGKGVGESYSKLFTSVSAVQQVGAGLQVINGLKPQASYESRAAELTSKVMAVNTSTVLTGLEKLGDPVEMATAFVSEAANQALPSADITPEEIGILRDQHLNKHVADQVLDESYRRNVARRDEVAALDTQLVKARADLTVWKDKEQVRVRAMLLDDCRQQQQRAQAAAAPAAPPAVGQCGGVLGSWKWMVGTATFAGDAAGGRASAAGNPHVKEGTWKCTGPDAIEISWQGGKYVDRMTLTAGVLVGKNQFGSPLRAPRADAPPASEGGQCVWRDGGAMFSSVCECTRDDGSKFRAPKERCGKGGPPPPETCTWRSGGTMFPSLCVCSRGEGSTFNAPRARCGR